MPETVGGLWITEYDFTKSFGVEPASSAGQAVLGIGESSTGLEVGDYVAYTFLGIVSYGVIPSIIATTERSNGREYKFQVVDNRVRLPWQIVFGQWNMPEDLEKVRYGFGILPPPPGEFAAGGATGSDNVDFGAGVGTVPPVVIADLGDDSVSRGRLYAHIVPSQWSAQSKCYTSGALSAKDIIRSAFKAALGNFGFSFDFHPDQDQPVLSVDANSGMTLAALVQQLTEAQGLEVTLDGSRTLRWERRGQGTLVIPPPPVHLVEDGQAMSADPTKVRVVGDRTLVQVNNISLEPDWRSAWEPLVPEPAWLDAVEIAFGPFEENSAGRAELAARAREVTLREYILAAEVGAGDYVDHGRWGKISRLNMPVWTYLNAIVFRSYRIPSDSQLYGIPMRSLEIHESLLCAVAITGTGGSAHIRYRADPVEFYPQEAAYVIAKGQPLDLVNAADRTELVKLRTTDMRTNWSEIADFTVDPANYSIRFASPVFIDGDPEENKSILLYPNQGQGGYTDVSEGLDPEADYLSIVVPNPDYEISPAQVKVSLVFRLGKFFRDYGTGARWSVHQANDLAEHLLDTTGTEIMGHALLASFNGSFLRVPDPPSGLKEILYDDGSSASDLAEAQSAGLIQKSGIERSGSYNRHGAAGTSVSGVIDRVTIKITRSTGIVETVEFSKPRSSSSFVASRDVARRVKNDELFNGQKELLRELRQLRGIAKLSRLSVNDRPRSTSHTSITDVFRTPIGGENSETKTYPDPDSAWPIREGIIGWRAGDSVWLDARGIPSREGQTWGGAVVSSSSISGEGEGATAAKYVTCCTSGTVPMAVAPGVGPGDTISATPGDWRVGNSGSYPLGMLNHSDPVPGAGESTMALVRLRANGSAKVPPLTLVNSRPPYIPAPEEPLVEGFYRTYMTWGVSNDIIADNWDDYFDVALTPSTSMSYLAKVFLNPEAQGVVVDHWEILAAADPYSLTRPTWSAEGARPEYILKTLATVTINEAGKPSILNTGGGSLELSEHIVDLIPGGGDGSTNVKKAISVLRLNY